MRKCFKSRLFVLLACLLSMSSVAHNHSSSKMPKVAEAVNEQSEESHVVLSKVWARATAPGMPMGAIYAEFQNNGAASVALVSLSTPVARLAEIHESIEIDGMMRMREITPFEIEPGATVSLVPGGKHIMLMGLKSALKEGELVPLSLSFSDGTAVEVKAKIGGFGQMSMP